VFRNILKLLLLSFAVWLIAVVVLLGIFVFVPNQSPWPLPSALTWIVLVGVAWLIFAARQVMKWRS
jgi:membrane protein YdbS with pleckstrin-like domain